MNRSSVSEALERISAFEEPEDAAWNLDWVSWKARLIEIVSNPWSIAQQEQNLCGPAAFFAFWFWHDPVAAAEFAYKMLVTGCSAIGERVVCPGPRSLIAQDYAHLVAQGKVTCPITDWMLLGSLRDSENEILVYEGDGRDTMAGITTPREMTAWLSATGLYREVHQEAEVLLRPGLDHALQLVPGVEDCAVLIHLRLLDLLRGASPRPNWFETLLALFPNHWVALHERLSLGEFGEVQVALWSFGEVYRGGVSQADFEVCYFGAVRAKVASST